MPKIIKDIEITIFDEATKIFCEKGYINSDMKAIAKACGIAVGTLYNYYPNKKLLYMDVVLKNWDKTIRKLGNIKKVDSKEEELKSIINLFYNEVENRNGLGKDLRELCQKGDDDFDRMTKEIFDNIVKVTMNRFELKEEFKSFDNINFRILSIWFASQFAMISDFENTKIINKEILYNTVSYYFNLQ